MIFKIMHGLEVPLTYLDQGMFLKMMLFFGGKATLCQHFPSLFGEMSTTFERLSCEN
jgi:hypothetical protein